MTMRLLCGLGCFTMLSLLTGCGGGGGFKPKGTVTFDGQPLGLSEKGMVVMHLIKESDTAGADQITVNTQPDGSFEVVGRDNHGIVPGKYRVAIQVFDPYSPSSSNDLLKGEYQVSNSKLVIDVTKDGPIKVDLPKPTGGSKKKT